MNPLTIGLLAAGCMFGGALAGLWLQRKLPAHHLDKESHETVKLGTGMIATITALVLGLLVSSAKGTFDTINDGVRRMCAKTLMLDRVLAQYGPEAQVVRVQLKRSVAGSLRAGESHERETAASAAAHRYTNRVEAVEATLRQIKPQSDEQRFLLSQAQQFASDMSQTRWLLMEQSQNELPAPLLVVLIGWLTALFVSLGMFSPRHGTVVTVLCMCAFSMAAALLLILEMNRPLHGIFKISGEPLRELAQHLGQ